MAGSGILGSMGLRSWPAAGGAGCLERTIRGSGIRGLSTGSGYYKSLLSFLRKGSLLIFMAIDCMYYSLVIVFVFHF